MKRTPLIIFLVAVALVAVIIFRRSDEGPQSDAADLVIALEVAPLTVDPAAVTDIHSSQVATAIHAPLGWTDQNGKFIPMVAERLEVSPDARKLSIALSTKATFWNGASVTATDVIYTLERYRRSQNMHRWILDRVEGIREFDEKKADYISGIHAESPNLLTIAYSDPEPDAATMLCNLAVAIVQKGSGESESKPFGLHVIGCGPYAPERFEPTSQLCRLRTTSANSPRTILFRTITDDAARLSAFGSKQAGIVRLRGPMIREVCQVSGSTLVPDERFAASKVSVFDTEELSYVIVNWQSPKLKGISENAQRNGTLALSAAIDRSKLVDSLFPQVCAEPTASVAPPSTVVSSKASMDSPQPESSFPQGLTLVSFNDSSSRQLATTIQAQLRAKGITIETEFVDLGKLIERLVKKEFDLLNCWIELQVPSSGPLTWCSFFDKAASLSAFGEPREDVSDILKNARSIVDPAARAKAYAQVVNLIDGRQKSWVPLMSHKAVVLHRDNISPAFDQNGTPVNGLIMRQ